VTVFEHGDRGAFLGRIRSRQGPPITVGPHPAPPPPDVVPEVRYRSLDDVGPDDLLPVFLAAAAAVSAEVHVGDVDAAIATIVGRHRSTTAVVSAEPEAEALRPLLERHGVDVAAYAPATAAVADLGVTSAIAAVAATGSVVVDAAVAGGRGASLLPTVHLCVVPRSRLVATPSDVLRRGPRPLSSNRVLITGPSRTGDIEQIITLGVHGPIAVHIVLT
jgi:L-lactate dehydrogenase complex protein LldG